MRHRSFLVIALTALVLVACVTSGGSDDSSTHWLAPCTAQNDCDPGLECTCGLCTLACDTARECSSLSTRAVCATLPEACGVAPICAPACETTADCASTGAGLACVGGACLPEVTGDAGAMPTVDSGNVSGQDASDAASNQSDGAINGTDMTLSWKLGQTGSPHFPDLAFSGERLAIASVAGVLAPRVVVSLEAGNSFDEVELAAGTAYDVASPGITTFGDGFRVAWWSTDPDQGTDNGAVRVQGIGADGTLGSEILVGNGVARAGCDIADLGNASAVVCGSSLLSICTADSCSAVALPACESKGDGRVVSDGASFTLARVCKVDDVSVSLRVSRFSSAGVPLLDEVEIARHMVFSGRPGLVRDGDRTVVAFAGLVYDLDANGQAAASPVVVHQPPNFLSDSVVSSELMLSAGTFVVSNSFDSTISSPVPGLHESSLVALDSGLALLGDVTPDGDYVDVAMAASSGGRAVLAHTTGTASTPVASTIALNTIDIATRMLEPPHYLEGLSPPRVLDVLCNGDACRLMVGYLGLAPAAGDEPARTVELSFSAESSAAPQPVREDDLCDPISGCTALLTNSGATVLMETTGVLRWVDAAGTTAWTEQLASNSTYYGPRSRSAPYLAVDSAVSSSIVHLDETGAHPTAVNGQLSPVLCDAGVYGFTSGTNAIILSPYEGNGPDLTLPPFGEPVCLADQMGVFTGSAFSRVSLLGDPLADVALDGYVVATGGDDGYALIATGETSIFPEDPRPQATIHRIPENGPVESRRLDFPEPAIIDGLWASGTHVHIAWHSERSVWLSSMRWQ